MKNYSNIARASNSTSFRVLMRVYNCLKGDAQFLIKNKVCKYFFDKFNFKCVILL
jgi:hypothetical protein